MNLRTKIVGGVAGLVLVGGGSAFAVAATSGSSPARSVQILTPSDASGSTTTVAPTTTTTVPVTTTAPATTTTTISATTTTVPEVVVPNVVGESLSLAESTLTGAHLQYTVSGTGIEVGSQSVNAGSQVQVGSVIRLVLLTPH